MQTRPWLKRELGAGVRTETEWRENGWFFFIHVCEKTKHSVVLLTTVRHTGWNGTIQTTSPRVSTAQTFPEPTAHSPAKNTAQRGNKTSWDHLYSLSTLLDAIHNSLYYSFFFSLLFLRPIPSASLSFPLPCLGKQNSTLANSHSFFNSFDVIKKIKKIPEAIITCIFYKI